MGTLLWTDHQHLGPNRLSPKSYLLDHFDCDFGIGNCKPRDGGVFLLSLTVMNQLPQLYGTTISKERYRANCTAHSTILPEGSNPRDPHLQNTYNSRIRNG